MKNQSDEKQTLKLVIEGDGYAWEDFYTPTLDPTPINPAGLQIATKLHATYLARPCQYVRNQKCRPFYWTDGRFDPLIIQTYMQALDQLKENKAQNFDLIGYSGGAYIALILAAQRDDIQKVITISGLLDPETWTAYHEISGLNLKVPIETLLKNSKNIEFTHYCGEDDSVVPCELMQDLSKRTDLLKLKNHKFKIIKNGDHKNAWKKVNFSEF